MSVVRAIDLTCDECYTAFDDPQWTVAQVREHARLDGWISRPGHDLCPDCRKSAAS